LQERVRRCRFSGLHRQYRCISHSSRKGLRFDACAKHFKSKWMMRTYMYNLTCNHRRQILHTTTGHPGRWNDKTSIHFDKFVLELRDGALNNKMDFEVRTQQGMSCEDTGGQQDRTLKLQSVYFKVDNGYLEWSTMVPPLKGSCNQSELRISQWLEPMRKDVKCTFGILKGRWRGFSKLGFDCTTRKSVTTSD
jgi:hypothetical protein